MAKKKENICKVILYIYSKRCYPLNKGGNIVKKCKSCQSEIDKKAKVCPNCGKKQSSKKGIIIAVIILLFVIIGFSGSNNSSNEEKTGTTNSNKNSVTEKFTLLDGYNGYAGDYNIGYYIEGYVQNNTDKEYSYVSIEFNLYDADGALIGTAMDNINNLEANGKWKFKASSLTTSEETAIIASYKLKEITGW